MRLLLEIGPEGEIYAEGDIYVDPEVDDISDPLNDPLP